MPSPPSMPRASQREESPSTTFECTNGRGVGGVQDPRIARRLLTQFSLSVGQMVRELNVLDQAKGSGRGSPSHASRCGATWYALPCARPALLVPVLRSSPAPAPIQVSQTCDP